jgi:hypothetical protein
MTILAQGTVFTCAGNTVGKVRSFSGIDGEASEIDVTTLASTAKEFRLGLDDAGSFSAEFLVDYTDTGQDSLRSAAASGAVTAFTLVLPSSPNVTLSFNGYVKMAQKVEGAVDGVVEGSASIKISGAVTES